MFLRAFRFIALILFTTSCTTASSPGAEKSSGNLEVYADQLDLYGRYGYVYTDLCEDRVVQIEPTSVSAFKKNEEGEFVSEGSWDVSKTIFKKFDYDGQQKDFVGIPIVSVVFAADPDEGNFLLLFAKGRSIEETPRTTLVMTIHEIESLDHTLEAAIGHMRKYEPDLKVTLRPCPVSV